LIGFLALFLSQRGCQTKSNNGAHKKVVINEAVRTLLYLPLYHAKERGYFAQEGVDVEIVTGGTATNSFAAMLSGQANFSQADPMYVPISREKGGRTRVVAQVVGRIAVWGLTKNPAVNEITKETLRNKTIATQPRPMTAYTYAIKTITDLGLVPDKDVKVIETQSPNEIVPFLNGQADYAFTLEPNTSLAVTKGAKVILSYPQKLGDQVFTGLMTTEDFISQQPDTVQAVVNAYQHALQDLKSNPQGGIATAKIYFPQLSEDVLQLAIKRLVDDEVWPASVGISDDSWRKALDVRIKVGDLKGTVAITDAMAQNFADTAQRKYPLVGSSK
jgi:NitT/TauT family transport system substrate-binding protein